MEEEREEEEVVVGKGGGGRGGGGGGGGAERMGVALSSSSWQLQLSSNLIEQVTIIQQSSLHSFSLSLSVNFTVLFIPSLCLSVNLTALFIPSLCLSLCGCDCSLHSFSLFVSLWL